MNKSNNIDLVLIPAGQDVREKIGKLRIAANHSVEVIDADELWKERINQIANTINMVDEIPVIGGTNINRIGTFTMMENVKKGDNAFPNAIISYLKINGFDAQIQNK